jgi:hypothetical protein
MTSHIKKSLLFSYITIMKERVWVYWCLKRDMFLFSFSLFKNRKGKLTHTHTTFTSSSYHHDF